MTGFWIGLAVGIGGGGALIWFGRNTIEKMVIGANALSRKLHAKADEIAAATKR